MNILVAKSNKTNFLFLLIILGTLYIYSRPLTGPFIWDDHFFILRNDSIRSVESLPDYFTSKETSAVDMDFSIYRPLRNVSYLIDYLLFGLNPFGFRMINLLLHIQNIVLLGYLIRLMTGSRFISVVSSAFFAFHPVQTEAVSWIKGRDDLLSAFFYLASLTLYIKGRERKIFYWGSVVSFAFALLAKEMAITLPLIILLYNLHFSQKGDKKLSYQPYIYIALLYLLLRTAVVKSVGQGEYWGGGFLASFYTNWTGIIYYLKLLFFPVNLCADYLMFPVRSTLLDSYVIGALLVILSLLGFALISFLKGKRLISFFLLWFFITLLPVSNIVPIQIVIAERFLYLPSIGMIVGAAVFLGNLRGIFHKFGSSLIMVLAFVISLFLSSMTVDRNHVWSDEHILWQDVVGKFPLNSRAWHNLAAEYQRQGKIPEAISHYNNALMMGYHSPESHYQLGRIYRGVGDEEKALSEFYAALKDDPENSDINYEIGNLMSKKGWYSDAIFKYNKALESNPDHEDALYDLGILYMKQNDYGLAAVQFKKLLLIIPENKMAAGFLEYCERMEREG